MRLRLCVGVVTVTLLVPTYGMAAGSSIRTPLVSSAGAATTRRKSLPPKELPTLGDVAPTDVMTRKHKSAVVQRISEIDRNRSNGARVRMIKRGTMAG